jgi:hypothetical protein
MFKKLFGKQEKDCCGVEINEVIEKTKPECCEETASQKDENCCGSESNCC